MTDNRKLIREMLSDITTTRQMIELSSEEFKIGLDSQVEVLQKWIESLKDNAKAHLFTKRIPLGTVIPQYKKLNSNYILYNENSGIRPAINQLVLIYDPIYDDLISGVISNFKPHQKGGQEGIIMVIDLMFLHLDAKLNKRKHLTQLISDDCLIFAASSEEIVKIYGMPEKGITLGICSNNGDIIETKIGGPLYYALRPELLKTHLMVGGVTGQGKTIFLKNLIYELAIHGGDDFFGSDPSNFKSVSNNAIIFDLQGDLVQVMEPMVKELIPDHYKQQYDSLNLKEFIGLKKKITNSDILFLKPFYVKPTGFMELFPWTDFGLDSKNIKTGEELTSLLPGLTNKGSQLIDQLFSMYMISHMDESNESHFNFNEFYEFVMDGVQTNEKGKKYYKWIETDVSDYSKTGEFDPNNPMEHVEKKDTIEATVTVADAMIRQLKVFKTLDVFDKVPELDIDKLLTKRLVFVYFPDYPGYTIIRSIMLLDILSRVYYIKRHNVDHAIKNNLIVIDEAHELLPRKRKSSDISGEFFDFIEKRFTRIAKEGRKYGISLVISSQILSELNEEVKFNAQTRIFFKLSEKDMKDLKLDKETTRLVNGLRKGYAVVYSRDNLEIGRSTEIKVIPPIYLHCDPRIADKYFKDFIDDVKEERKNMIEDL